MSEINSEETWSKSCRKFEKKSNQTKIFYRCNKVKQRNKIQCSTGLVIIYLADSLEVEILEHCAYMNTYQEFTLLLLIL